MYFLCSGASEKTVDVYLPIEQELEVIEIGLDDGATCMPVQVPHTGKPIVLYGSSIAQGIGASRPGLSYIACLARHMHRRFVNLGFGGAGRAQKNVVEYVAQVDAECFVLDVGRSYKNDDPGPFEEMVKLLRIKHPHVSIVALKPVFYPPERYDSAARDNIEKVRNAIQRAVERRIAAGDGLVFLIESFDLLGPSDDDALYPQVHPMDPGHAMIARRLQARLEQILANSP
jgi:hypothetical protein